MNCGLFINAGVHKRVFISLLILCLWEGEWREWERWKMELPWTQQNNLLSIWFRKHLLANYDAIDWWMLRVRQKSFGGVGVKRRKPYWLIQHSSLRTAEDDLAWVKLYSRQVPEKRSRDVKFYNQRGNANVLTGEDLILDSFQYCGQSFQDLYWGLAISQWNTFSALLLL